MMFCKKCGKENDTEAKFCAFCGEPVDVVENTINVATPPEVTTEESLDNAVEKGDCIDNNAEETVSVEDERIAALRKYKELVDDGIISELDFERKKEEIMCANKDGVISTITKKVKQEKEKIQAKSQAQYEVPDAKTEKTNSGSIKAETKAVTAHGITDDEELNDNSKYENELLHFNNNDSTQETDDNENKGSELVVENSLSDNGKISDQLLEESATNTDKPMKNKKKYFIIGAVIAAIVIVIIVVFANRPSLKSISAEYSGDTVVGTEIDGNSDITVTAKYEDDSEETIDGGWTIDGGELDIGSNYYEVEYEGKKCDLNIYSPLIQDGRIIATNEQIQDEFKSNAELKTDWFEGFGEEENFGKEITGLDSGCNAYLGGTKDKKDISDDEIPDSIILTTYNDLDTGSLEQYKELSALVLYSIDPDLDWDEAKEKMDSENDEAAKEYQKALKKKQNTYSYTKELDNEKIVIAFIPMGDQLIIIASFQDL